METPFNHDIDTIIVDLLKGHAHLEHVLERCLRTAIADTSGDPLSALLQQLSFRQQLAALTELVARRHTRHTLPFQQFKRWRRRVRGLRVRRNQLVHRTLRRTVENARALDLHDDLVQLRVACDAALASTHWFDDIDA